MVPLCFAKDMTVHAPLQDIATTLVVSRRDARADSETVSRGCRLISPDAAPYNVWFAIFLTTCHWERFGFASGRRPHAKPNLDMQYPFVGRIFRVDGTGARGEIRLSTKRCARNARIISVLTATVKQSEHWLCSRNIMKSDTECENALT